MKLNAEFLSPHAQFTFPVSLVCWVIMKINERCPLVGGMALCMQRSGEIFLSLALAFWMWCFRMVSGNSLNYTHCTKESLIAKLVPLSCLRFWCCAHETCCYASGMSRFAAWVPDEKREMFLECLSKVESSGFYVHRSISANFWICQWPLGDLGKSHRRGWGRVSHTCMRKLGANTPNALLQPC